MFFGILLFVFGPLAQLVERPDGIGEVRSSILLRSTKYVRFFVFFEG